MKKMNKIYGLNIDMLRLCYENQGTEQYQYYQNKGNR